MGDSKKIESLVEQAVGEVLNSLLPGLRQQIVSQVLQVLRTELDATAGAAESCTLADSRSLNDALAAIQTGTTQVQILDAMVDGAAKFVARIALFIVRGTSAVGWRARGFTDNDAVRNCPVDLTFGLSAHALQERGLVSGRAAEFAHGFTDRFGTPVEPALVCPLVVRDKVVAIIYVDGGTGEHQLDRPALEALIRGSGIWLEVFATRKMSTPAHAPEHAVEVPSSRAAAASATSAVTAVMEVPVPAAVETAPQPAPAPPASPSPAEDEVHKKARRFAKLLAEEIKLYNQAKVVEGRKNRDLYDRLKEDIEKSRASYEKRYGNTTAKDSDYFNQELVRILADNDSSLLGGNFPR